MKTKKFLIGLLSLVCVTAGSFGLVGCGDNSAENKEPTEIEAVYAQYVVYAEEQGQTPLSYEDWLTTIKGEKGDQGEKGDKGDQGVGIEKVGYDANGDLLITFTDGTTQTVAMPKQEYSEGLHYQRIAGKDECCVIGLGPTAGWDIVIPATYNGLPVTEIAAGAFHNCSSLTSVIIPDSVTSIGESAFNNCSSLTSIEIPDGVTSIERETFYGCSSLMSVVISGSVTSIGVGAFMNCRSLTSIEFKGTYEQWSEIDKGLAWDFDRSAEVICVDGKVSL